MSRDQFHPGEGFRCNPAPTAWEPACRDAVPHGCFADETAIDFPSVDHLLRRVRDAFTSLDEQEKRELARLCRKLERAA